MKLFHTAICVIFFCSLLFLFESAQSKSALLGAKECTWGPGYWCSNITNAKNCHAVRHCIQTVWEKQNVPEDNDSICQICLDMVKQARDQLESNETQEDLRAVFEGSCKLIPLKPIQNECIKLADDFIPELVEALASQMNPQVVCSVAGLCNNARIDQMLAEMLTTTTTLKSTVVKSVPLTLSLNTKETNENKALSCTGCNTIATLISNKFSSTNRDDFLEGLLRFCGEMSTFSDACSNIVISYFDDIYREIKASMNSDAICHVAGVCSAKYHQHPELVEIRPMSDVGVVQLKDDLPCELCEQLVRHLRDLLVANTTEAEFKQVLDGLCKQTKGFKEECLSIVDQYYDLIYNTLVNNLDANGACFMIGVCPKGLKNFDQSPIIPLLPSIPPQKLKVTIIQKTSEEKKPVKKLLGENEPIFTKEEIQSMQLPIDRILGPKHPETLIQNGEFCTLCEYFLHFLQEALASPANEDKIKEAVMNTCQKLPNSVRGKCDDFVDMYGDAIIALLIQEMDPREICPMLKLCPSNQDDMEVFAPQPIDVKIDSKSSTKDKPTCPLCLLAVQQIKEMIKTDKSKENIKHALDTLCNHLPKKLQAECVDFVDTYSSELVEMLITDFTPQQICSYLKLCPDNKPDLTTLNIKIDNNNSNQDDEILTNEIPDDTINGQLFKTTDKEVTSTPECLLCQKIVKEAEKKILNPKSREQVKDALEHACDKLQNKQLIAKCHVFIEKNGDLIVDLLIKEMTPKMICREMGYCFFSKIEDHIGNDPPEPPCDPTVCVLPECYCPDDGSTDLDIDEALKIDVIAIPSSSRQKITNLDDDTYTRQLLSVNKDNTPCVICEFIMTKIEQELQNKTTQDDIKSLVKNICKKMPKTIEQNCNKFMADYADLIINLLDSIPPKQICQRINLCATKSNMLNVELSIMNDEIVECGLCYGVSAVLSKLVKSDEISNKNDNKLNVQNMIDNACENFNAKYYKKCTQLIHYYGQSIINLIKFGVDNSQICARIGKCFENEHSVLAYVQLQENSDVPLKRESRETNIPGSNKCSWGPSYWCSDKSKAEECNVVDFCVEKVWGQETAVKRERRETTTERLLGAKKCTWGPSYWCSDKSKAEECDAVKFCVEKVWGQEVSHN